jgi:WD40 repeat protein
VDTSVVESNMKGHTYYIRGIIQLEDGRLCSCSIDKTIKLWNSGSGLCNLTINGHTEGAYFVIQLIDGRLCGSGDNTIKIWNNDAGACELTIDANGFLFSIVQLKDGRICGVRQRKYESMEYIYWSM